MSRSLRGDASVSLNCPFIPFFIMIDPKLFDDYFISDDMFESEITDDDDSSCGSFDDDEIGDYFYYFGDGMTY